MNVKHGKVFAIALFMFALLITVFWIVNPVFISDENGFNFRWILPPEYYQGNNFQEGRAWVQEKKDGPWTLFDTEGNVIKMGFIAKDIWQRNYKSNTVFIALETDIKTGFDMYGFIDYSGDILSAAKHLKPPFYQEGIAEKEGENSLWGFIDFQENWIIPPIYENIQFWIDGLMPAKKNGKWGYINKKGETVVDFRFEKVYQFSNGLFVASQNSLYGLVDKSGNWVTEAIYERIFYPWSDLIGAQKDGKIGFLDVKGNVVIDFKFTGMEGTGMLLQCNYAAFSNERAIVPISKEKKDGETIYRWVVIDKYGDIVPTKQYEYFISQYANNGFAVAIRDDKPFFLDREGKEYSLPSAFQQGEVRIYPSDDDIYKAHFKKEEKMGYFKIENRS